MSKRVKKKRKKCKNCRKKYQTLLFRNHAFSIQNIKEEVQHKTIIKLIEIQKNLQNFYQISNSPIYSAPLILNLEIKVSFRPQKNLRSWEPEIFFSFATIIEKMEIQVLDQNMYTFFSDLQTYIFFGQESRNMSRFYILWTSQLFYML